MGYDHTLVWILLRALCNVLHYLEVEKGLPKTNGIDIIIQSQPMSSQTVLTRR